MSEMGEHRDEPRPPVDRSRAWRRLWDAVHPHAVDPGDLGQYAVLLRRWGPVAAQRDFPEVAAHLARSCAQCREDLEQLVTLLDRELPAAAPPPYFHPTVGPTADDAALRDALRAAVDALKRLRPELVRALEEVRRSRHDAEREFRQLGSGAPRQPDRARDVGRETTERIRAAQEALERSVGELDEALSRYRRSLDEL